VTVHDRMRRAVASMRWIHRVTPWIHGISPIASPITSSIRGIGSRVWYKMTFILGNQLSTISIP